MASEIQSQPSAIKLQALNLLMGQRKWRTHFKIDDIDKATAAAAAAAEEEEKKEEESLTCLVIQ